MLRGLTASLLLPALLLLPACDEKSGGPGDDSGACDTDDCGEGTGGDTDGEPMPDAGSPEKCVLGASQGCPEEPGQVQYCLPEGSWGVCFDPTDSCTPGDGRETDCGFDFELPMSETCVLDPTGVPVWQADDPDACNTPLVLVPEGRTPVFLTGATHTFAVSASSCITTDWPTADTPWLARDLDGNGAIDGGHELFGNGTSLASGRRADHGFAALAPLDRNGDGRVDANDPAFSSLLLWADRDGDRRSTPDELTTLPAAGVRALPLDYSVAPACDERGNCSRERAAVEAATPASLVDVYLPCR